METLLYPMRERDQFGVSGEFEIKPDQVRVVPKA